jgi:membrane-associated phospholipid phosphatase
MLVLALTLSLTAAPEEVGPSRLAWDPRIDIPVTATLAAGWLVSEFAVKKQLAPAACRWCETNAFDTWVRSAFNPGLVPSESGISAPARVSDVLAFGVVPFGMLGLDALLAWRDGVFADAFWIDALLILEATMVAQVLNQIVKFSVGRARPYTVGASAELLAGAHDPADHHVSFFSGHATWTFALATATATVVGLRGYRSAWVAWLVGVPLAVSTAFLRVAADKHWTTDVLLGAVVGSTAGILIPGLLHRRVGPLEVQVSAMPNGVAVAGRFD